MVITFNQDPNTYDDHSDRQGGDADQVDLISEQLLDPGVTVLSGKSKDEQHHHNSFCNQLTLHSPRMII